MAFINKYKRLLCTGIGIWLSFSICFSNSFVSCAEVDREAEQEARRAIPIASNSYEQWPAGPIVSSQSAILMEVETGTILYEKNIHEHLYPASTTKILTCLIGMENCQLNETVTMSHEAVFSIERGSSNVGLDVGEQITVEQCLYAILVGSANEAANALGEHVDGSIEAFVARMNKRARELGCSDSHFVTTNGLHDDEHYTSAYDLALIGQKFFDNETLCKMSSTPRYYIPQSPTQPDEDLYINTHNKLLFPGGKYNIDYIVGSKTGYTEMARQTLVSCAEKNGMKLICVVMKEESPSQYEDTISLFDYGFTNFQKFNVAANETEYTVENNDFFQTQNDVFGTMKPILEVNPSANVVAPVTAVFTDLESTLTYDLESDISVAKIDYSYHGIPVGSATIDLIQEESVSPFDFTYQEEEMGHVEEIDETEGTKADPETEADTDIRKKKADSETEEEHVIFVNIRKVIVIVTGAAGFFIFLCVIKAIISNYQFARRREAKKKRRKSKKLRF